MSDYEDPGWRGATRGVGWFLVPIVHSMKMSRRTSPDLIALRRQWVNILTSMFLLLGAIAFIEPWDSGHGRWVPIGVAVIGVACVIYISRLQRRPLRTESRELLAASYRILFFISLGPSVIPMVFGLCGALLDRSLWVGLVGLPFTMICFALCVPSRRNIERRQREMQALGSPLSLGQALIHQTPLGPN